MSEPVFAWGILLGAAFVGGGLNAVAGGGSFLTFPALIYAGVSPVAANASGTLALLPGYLASTWGFREDLGGSRSLSLRATVAASMLGGAGGALLLLVTPDATFRAIVPWLLLAATILFAIGPWLLRVMRRAETKAAPRAEAIVLLAVSVYGGYFNGGLGIILLAAFGLLGHRNINAMNGLKNLVSAVLTAVAVTLYAAGNAIVLPAAAGMMVAATGGGYLAARIARRLPAVTVRAVVVGTGAVMTFLFFRY